ncbi:MAG: ABC transporter ATP-binding protein, partial [Planctomycetaceae bacterium]|nr:ABC transporter ATP-binding protein [Planctomycetaceae bacterium]
MIEAIDVRKSFDAGGETVEALRGVTFRLPSESCTFIVGPSGSGKSTLLYLIGALDRPTSGTIRVEDWDITAMTESEQDAYRRDRVGFVFQSFNLIGNLSAVGNVLLSYIPLGVTPDLRAKAEGLLRQVGLGDRLNHRPNQLSGGQQQRVAVARALIKDPVLILADEPTGNLDRAGGEEIIRLLRDR